MRRDDSDLPEQHSSAGAADDPVARVKADQEHLKALQRARQARVAKVLVALALVVVLVVFIIQNSQRVPVDFVFVTRMARLIWVMLACAVVGGVVGYLIGRPGKQFPLHKRSDEHKKEEER